MREKKSCSTIRLIQIFDKYLLSYFFYTEVMVDNKNCQKK